MKPKNFTAQQKKDLYQTFTRDLQIESGDGEKKIMEQLVTKNLVPQAVLVSLYSSNFRTDAKT